MNKLEPKSRLTEEELMNLGLKCGLEIHQQLEGRKLFCNCPTNIRDDKENFTIKRRLRAIAGEGGKVDMAAADEQKKKKFNIYEGYNDTTCLVELDEMPPQKISPKALDSSLAVAKIFGMNIVDQIRFMRKIVVDGSNTSGFQRTSLVGMDGKLPGHDVRVEALCLEEDSCRIVEKNSEFSRYNLSRLGIPLIEIATAPDLKTPKQVAVVSEYIGMVLRSLDNVKRGLGTIRQDVNVSIREGVRVEVKGAQDLKMISTIVEYEALRQKNMLDLFKELNKRGASVVNEIVDITEFMNKSESKVIKLGLEKKSGVVVAVRLKQFNGLTGFEVQPGRRFGSELSDYGKTMGVKGLFHSDELPNYGITQEEKDGIYNLLNLNKDNDAFILISDAKTVAMRAMNVVIERASDFNLRKEVRMPRQDGTSSYMRPMPGASRMYPETDVRPIVIDRDSIVIPKLLSKKIDEMKEEFGLAEDIVKRIIRDKLDIRGIMKKYPNLKVGYIVDFFYALPSIVKRKYKIETQVIDFADEVLPKLNDGVITKDAVVEVLGKLGKGETVNYDDFKLLSIEDIEQDVKAIVESLKDKPRGAIIGQVMAKYKGKVDGKAVNQLISKFLN